jgi:hypothetical protein
MPNGDTDTTGAAQALRIYGGKVQQTYNPGSGSCIVRDFGQQSGIWTFTEDLEAAVGTLQDRYLVFSAAAPSTATFTAIRVRLRSDKSGTHTLVLDTVPATTSTTITLATIWADADQLTVKIDATAKRIYFFRNLAVLGDPAGYDLSAWAGPWTSKAGFQVATSGTTPAPGENLISAITFDTLTSNSITTATISQQASGYPWQKQLDFTASIGDPSATGAQFKIETEAGQFVQGWTTATFASGTASGTYLIADHAFEGQKLKVLVKNVGGTVKTTSGLTATNSYVLDAKMLIGINDDEWNYYSPQIAGRDWFDAGAETRWGVMSAAPTTSDRQYMAPAGMVQDNYNHWAEAYSASQLYPSTNGSSVYQYCRYQGLSWLATDTTARTRAAPSTANTSGAGADWKLATNVVGDASLIGLNGDGIPTKLPDDPNLTIFREPAWHPPSQHEPFTVLCKTQPGIAWKLSGNSLGTLTLTQTPADIAAGQFTLNYLSPAPSDYNGFLYVDRANSTATLDGTFFLSGIPSYETGTPSADTGGPYISADKQGDMTPFAGIRYMKPAPIEKKSGSWTGTWTAANNTVSGSTRLWKYICDTANRLNHKYVRIAVPSLSDATYVTAMATFFRDNLNADIPICVELSNEDWNGNYLGAQELSARAAALVNTDAAYNKPYLLHCREHNAMVVSWKTVFGSAYAARVQPVLAWQSGTTTSTWQQMLDFESTWQNVARCSIAPYADSGIGNYTASPNTAWGQDLVIADIQNSASQATFNGHMFTFMTHAADAEVALAKALFNFLPGYSLSKGLSKNAIQIEYYEAGWFATTSATSWDTAFGAGTSTRAIAYFDAWKRDTSTTGGGAWFAYYIDQLAKNGPGMMNAFTYVGGTNGWGLMDAMTKTTQEPFATVKTKALAYNV